MAWYMVEFLSGSDNMTIVFRDGARMPWSSIGRVQRDEGVELGELLKRTRDRAIHTPPHLVDGKKGPRLVEAVPMQGVDRKAYGIQLWVGGPNDDIPEPRRAAIIDWKKDTLQVEHTLESLMMSSDDPGEFSRVRAPGEFLRKSLRFDNVDELTALALDPVPGSTFESRSTVLHDDGHIMAWRAVARAFAPDERGIAIRCINHDVTDTEEPEIGPVEAFESGAPAADDSLIRVLLAFPPQHPEMVIIVRFIGTPPAWVDYVRGGDNSLIHPEDWAALRRTQGVLSAATPDAVATTPVRIRAHTDNGWQSVEVVSRRYPGLVGDNLHIAQLRRLP